MVDWEIVFYPFQFDIGGFRLLEDVKHNAPSNRRAEHKGVKVFGARINIEGLRNYKDLTQSRGERRQPVTMQVEPLIANR